MSAPTIEPTLPLTLRKATLKDCIAMWWVASHDLLSPVAYASMLRRLPKRCECLVACVDGEVVGFVVACGDDDTLHVLDLQLSSREGRDRMFEILHAVAAWPDFAHLRTLQADASCPLEVRAAVSGAAHGLAAPAAAVELHAVSA